MVGMCDDPVAGQSRHEAMPFAVCLVGRRRVVGEFTVGRIKAVVMTAEQCEQAVNALATLIVQWVTTPRQAHSTTAGHPGSD